MALSLPPGNSKFDPTAAIPNGPFYSQLVSTVQGPWYPLVVGAGLNVDYTDSVLSGGGGPSGGVILVNTGTGLTGGPITSSGTVSMANTTVVPGSYTLANITVDAQGRITSAANGTVVTVPAATPVVLGAILGCTTLVKTSVGCNSLLSNTSGVQNNAFGTSALEANTTGSCNTAAGHEALKGNTTGSSNAAFGNLALTVSNGGCNSAFGSGSLRADSSGSCNSGFGFDSLASNSTGCANTAVGACALGSNVAGFCNVASGFRSLFNVTTGCFNVSVGASAGSAITTESCNLILGSLTGQTGCSGHIYLGNGDGSVLGLRVNEFGAWSPYNSGAGLNTAAYGTAGQFLVSCGANAAPQWTSTISVPAATPTVLGTVKGCTIVNQTAVGCNALLSNAGSMNVAVGDSALCATTGSYNTAVGDGAMVASVAGNFNTSVGYEALRGNTSGGCNVAIGSGAGSAITTECNNVVLGGFAGVTGSSSNIYIANGSGGILGLRINDCGAWSPYNSGAGLATAAYGTAGQVLVSCGANASPQWTSNPVITVTAATPIALGTVYGCTVVGCTSLGCNALLNNTGANNVAIGENVLCYNTSGSSNTAVGFEAMCGNDGGSCNTAVGFQALAYNTFGRCNTVVGYQAFSCGNTSCNIAIGLCAMYCGATNSMNIAIGDKVGQCGLDRCNTIIGWEAACSVDFTACENTLIGTRAGEYAVSVCGNVGVGGYVLGNVAGNCNTAIGLYAGSAFTGSNNIAIGARTVCRGGCTLGNNNIVIGYNSGVDLTTANGIILLGTNTGSNVVGCDNSVLITNGAGIEVAFWNDCGALSTLGAGVSDFGTAGYVLTSQGPTAPPIWASASGSAATPIALGTVYGCTIANRTALGLNALAANTGSFNTAVGNNALQANTSGTCNTAVGHLAIANSDIGTENTAVGFCSGRCLSGNSCRNVFVGAGSGSIATDAGNNVGIGYQAACCITTGTGNVVVGSRAGRCLQSGAGNTLVGRCAGNATTTAGLNVALGECALLTNTTGCQNIALGYLSLACLSTGVGNIAIGGSSAGTCLTTESFNVIIGADLGASLVGCNNHVILADGCGCMKVAWDNIGAMSPGGPGNYGTTGQVLTSNGPGVLPAWCSLVGSAATPIAIGSVYGCTVVGCTALGCNALLNNTGANNVAIGESALCSNTTGCCNTVVGYNAMCGNTTGNYNTALGVGAMSVGDPDSNVAIGYFAANGTSSNTGNSVVIGYCAGTESGGFCNVIIGSGAAPAITGIGQFSVIIGQGAGQNLQNSCNNVFIGRQSGRNVTDGFSNTVIGTQSGRCLTTGNFNTIIGTCVAYLGLSTGCCNIYLGSAGGAARCLGTEDNNVVIGNSEAQVIAGCSGHVLISSGANGVGERVMAVWNDCAALDPGGVGNYGTLGYVLTSQGPTAPPIWAAQAGGGAATPTSVGTVFGYTGSASNSGVSLGCCALGNPSLPACGIGNVGVGLFAGYNVGASGASNYNTAIGNYALGTDAVFPVANLRGTGNTALGFSAGLLKSTAQTSASNYNTYIGHLTGVYSNPGVSCNTFVGALAGYGGANATGVNNTTIGYCSVISTVGSSNQIVLGNASNTIIRAAVTSITSLSDGRDKSNVADLPVGLEFVNSLHPVKFTWQQREPNPIKDGSLDSGFIAQEVQKVQEDYNASEYLGLVHDENPEKLEVTPGKLIPVLVKAIQELSAKNADLEARLAKLESPN